MTTSPISKLFRDLDQGARAVTSSRRLARQVAQRYADWKIAAGASAWPTPSIRVLDDWLFENWQWHLAHDADTPDLLGDDQELLLWEQVIRRRSAHDDGRVLLQLAGTARAARRTWRRVHDWCLDWERLRAHRSADTEAFLGWAGAARVVLDDRRWLTTAELPAYLAARPEAWMPANGGPMWWMGFDALPPAHRCLWELLQDHGCPQVRFDNAGKENSGPVVTECADAEEEWYRIARWARTELDADPRQSLGVVCPDLGRHRDRIEEILEEVLHPELAWRPDAARSFHLSLGRPLPEYPVVNTALDLLRWTQRRIPFDVVSRVLRSPYPGGADVESDNRVRFELSLRARQQETFSLKRLGVLARREAGLDRLEALFAVASRIELPDRAAPGEWAAVFTDWLRAFGWPGDRPQNSHEFQTVTAWREQLSVFASLGTVQNQWSLGEALKKLVSLTAMRVLQFHDDQAPLQVMGATEASGLWFDKLWLADMSDAVWPPPAQPDPFIPVSLQKACGMPDASAQTVLERTRVRTDNLLAGAGELRVSFAARDAEVPAALSPLFHPDQVESAIADDTYPGRVAQLLAAAPPLEAVEDRRAPPLVGDIQRGGVGLVADQARCPFQALAHHRLRARELPEVTPGLSAMERGILVHRVAHAVWERLESLEALHALDDAARRELVADCVTVVLERRYTESSFQKRFLEIEAHRLEVLILEWLALETRRDPFRVAATELETRVTIGGVEFRVRVDRIDELPDGRRLIIDYKTGQLAPIREWIEPRTEEPQLPMYALSVDEEIAALALAGLRRGECELRGVGEGAGVPASLKPVSELGCADMAGLKSRWRSALGGLVDEHRRGVADVDPKTPQTCRLCDAMSLCRIFERTGSGNG